MTSPHGVRPYGPRAVLVTPRDGVRPAELAAAVADASRSDVVEVVPGAATVLVVLGDRDSRHEITDWLTSLDVEPVVLEDGEAGSVVVEVVYDGADLATVADESGLSIAEVISRHSGAVYRCEFCGFAPGFAYLSGLDPALVLPRRSTPRTSVPAGSVGIAGPYTAVYPTASPGGWHLLGRTDVTLFDPSADPPALITPGTRVTFSPVRESSRQVGEVVPPRSKSEKDPSQTGGRGGALRVVSAGVATSYQDGGRPGYAAVGVPTAGALDSARRHLVNRLVGNAGSEAVIETAGGLVLEALEPVVIADSSTGALRSLTAGETVNVVPYEGELWVYLAVRGGFDVEPLLGSRSRDTLSRLGPAPPEAGDVLAVGSDPRTSLATEQAPPPDAPGDVTVRVWEGPRLDWFVDGSFEHLVSTSWTVSTDVSRVGMRLHGPALQRRDTRTDSELPSEGLVIGAIQIPPDGQPVVMLADHPTTGGYPVIGVVEERDLGALVQSRPGTMVRTKQVTR